MSALSKMLGQISLLGLAVDSEYFGGVDYKTPKSFYRDRSRGKMPVFHKCKSCGFDVVDYQLDENGICRDCREE